MSQQSGNISKIGIGDATTLTPRELYLLLLRLEELVDQRLSLEEQARELQADEYERRLTGLNHERAEERSKRSEYLSRQEYLSSHKELQVKLESDTTLMSKDINTLAARMERMEARNVGMTEAEHREIEAKGIHNGVNSNTIAIVSSIVLSTIALVSILVAVFGHK